MYTVAGPKQLEHKAVDDGQEFYNENEDDEEDPLRIRPKKKHRRSKSKEIERRGNDKPDAHPTHSDVEKLSNDLGTPAVADICVPKEPMPTTRLLTKEMTDHILPKHFSVDCAIEVLSQDSGIRGCWFRAVVIKRSKQKVKVRYQDLKDAEDETSHVEEWVLASRIAAPDELGIRLCGRTTVRPFPSSPKDGVSLGFVDIGTPVDAWWHDGWWEGIVVRKESDGKVHVYFPGEKKFSVFGCNDLRRSQEWLCNKWNYVEDRPDAVSSILSGLETLQDGGKSSDGVGPSNQLAVSTEQLASNKVTSKEDRAACNQKAPCLEPQNDRGKGKQDVPNLEKDKILFKLRWNPARKRRRSRERSQRRGLKQNSEGSSSSSREDLEMSPDCQRFLTPNSLIFDHESCKYQGDSLLNASIPPLTGLVLSR